MCRCLGTVCWREESVECNSVCEQSTGEGRGQIGRCLITVS